MQKEEAKIEHYQIAKGIQFIYCDINTLSVRWDGYELPNYIEINHCKEGIFECEFDTNSVGFVSQGDLAINMYTNPTHSTKFPLKRYVGISIYIDANEIEPIQVLPSGVEVNALELFKGLCPRKHCFFLRDDEVIQSIFQPLYQMSNTMRKEMHLLKWWELLIYLSDAQTQSQELQTEYLPYTQIEKIKEVEAFLVSNVETHITIKELSERFKISETTLKENFSGVFGKPIFTYMREYRCHVAASMLIKDDKKISEIASVVGYKNPSKFSGAFVSLYGITPQEYRNN